MTDAAQLIDFGRPLREEQFSHHQRDVVRLNNGSFGACPADVLQVQRSLQDEWNSNPDDFWHSLERRFGEASAAVASRLLGGARKEDVFLVDNLTTGMAILVHSLIATISEPNCVIVLANHTYNAVKLAVQHGCQLAELRHGTAIDIAVVNIPFPILTADHDDVIVDAYAATLSEIAIGKVVRFAIVDHISSVPAMKLPIHRIIPLLRAHGAVEVIVDGAHTPGQLDLRETFVSGPGPAVPDYYLANLHKWCFAPISAAFLWISPSAPSRNNISGAHSLHHPIISHSYGMGLSKECAMLGTKDYSAMLSVPACFDFIERRLGGFHRLRERNCDLCFEAAVMLSEAWGTTCSLPPKGLCTGTAMVGCPKVFGDTFEEGERLRLCLRAWAPRHELVPERKIGELDSSDSQGIPLPRAARGGIVVQKFTAVAGDRLFIRLSAAAYNTMDEFQVLRDAVLDIAEFWNTTVTNSSA